MDQSYHQIRRGLLIRTLKIFDLVSIGATIFFAAWVHFRLKEDVSFSEFLSMRVSISNVLLLIVLWSGFYAFFEALHLYRSRRLEKWYAETFELTGVFAFCTLLLFAWKMLFSIGIFDAWFLLTFFAASVVWFTLTRLILRLGLIWVRGLGRNLRHVVIVGTNRRALSIGKRFQNEPALGYHLVGFVDTMIAGEGWADMKEPLLCDFDHFEEFLRSHVVDDVILCLPLRSLHREASKIAAACKVQGIPVRQMGDLYGMTNLDTGVELLDIYDSRRQIIDLMIKRLLDIGVSFFLLLVLFPFFCVVALLIKLDSRGPILFVQERIGHNKRRFKLFKFRTMNRDAEQMINTLNGHNEQKGPVFKIKNDPRITPVGRRLRKYSIDELPQLFNVLRGDMSLVGPRPLPVRDYEGFSEDWHRRRCSIRPGLTCLWQVTGRNEVPFERWMELDMEYIDNWSLRVDIAILLRTVPAVFSGKGAA